MAFEVSAFVYQILLDQRHVRQGVQPRVLVVGKNKDDIGMGGGFEPLKVGRAIFPGNDWDMKERKERQSKGDPAVHICTSGLQRIPSETGEHIDMLRERLFIGTRWSNGPRPSFIPRNRMAPFG